MTSGQIFLKTLNQEETFMDDVVIQKAASIERCLARVKEEFVNAGEGFNTN